MRTHKAIIAVTTAFAFALLTGCGDSTENKTPATPEAETSTEAQGVTESVVESVKEAAQPVVEEATKTAEQVATEAKSAASAAAADATIKANDLIAKAKSLISETKYSDAMNIINQLKSMKLTPEQEKLVADLKAQVEKAMSALSSTNAAGALNSLLK